MFTTSRSCFCAQPMYSLSSFKPENILLNSDGHCVLTDFGLAKDFTDSSSENEDERARTLCGTMEYMVRFKEEL